MSAVPVELGGRANSISLSAPGGGEGRGEVGDSGVLAGAHLTLPLRGPLPLPPEGRRRLLIGGESGGPGPAPGMNRGQSLRALGFRVPAFAG
jgi:hypothetical protein